MKSKLEARLGVGCFLLIITILAVPTHAEVLSATVGINSTCPYGLIA